MFTSNKIKATEIPQSRETGRDGSKKKFPRPNKYNAKVVSRSWLTKKVIQFIFELPTKSDFVAGQFFNVMVAPGMNRSYSISSSPQQNQIEIIVDISPGGVGSKFFENLEESETVQIILPLGRFIYIQSDRPANFIATGTGIAPLKSMIEYELFTLKSNREINLYFGLRNVEDIFYLDKLKSYADQFKNFKFTICISSPEFKESNFAGERMKSGRVTKVIDPIIWELNAHNYICGGQNMIDDVKEILISKGISAENIFQEQYY